jgi:hypothetical protein
VDLTYMGRGAWRAGPVLRDNGMTNAMRVTSP